MTKLFIDDIRDPVDASFAVVRSYEDAIAFMQANGCPLEISFDHDLGEEDAKTGFDVAKWMIEEDLNADGKFMPGGFEYFVHSANPVGAANIRGLLDNYLAIRDIYNLTTKS